MAVIIEDSCSANSSLDTTIPVKLGSSSLIKSKETLVSLVNAFSTSPKIKVIGSLISTASSNKPAVEIVILPELPFAGITICLTSSTIMYSSSNTADNSSSDNVNGIVTSAPETVEAVNVTVVVEFSSIVGDERANVTSDSSSSSVNSSTTGFVTLFVIKVSLKIAFSGVPGWTIIDSVNSYKSSSIPVIVKLPVVSPAAIFSCGESKYELTELLYCPAESS